MIYYTTSTRNMRKAVSLFLIGFALSGCNREGDLAPRSYAAYMEDASHDMKRTVKNGAISYTIQLATPEYVASKELGDGTYSETDFSERLTALKDYTFFYITISGEGAPKWNDPALAGQRDMYYMQSAGDDIRLVYKNRELAPATYHFENNFGLSPYNTLLVAFKTGAEMSGSLQLVFNDRFNDNYLIKSSFKAEAITQLPNLVIN